MSDKPKRKFCQFHLSTAGALMLTASGVLWLNTLATTTPHHHVYGFPTAVAVVDREIFLFERGGVESLRLLEKQYNSLPVTIIPFRDVGAELVSTQPHYIARNIIINLGFLFVSLISVAYPSEWLIRRSEAQRT
jgi:hypothetical protein